MLCSAEPHRGPVLQCVATAGLGMGRSPPIHNVVPSWQMVLLFNGLCGICYAVKSERKVLPSAHAVWPLWVSLPGQTQQSCGVTKASSRDSVQRGSALAQRAPAPLCCSSSCSSSSEPEGPWRTSSYHLLVRVFIWMRPSCRSCRGQTAVVPAAAPQGQAQHLQHPRARHSTWYLLYPQHLVPAAPQCQAQQGHSCTHSSGNHCSCSLSTHSYQSVITAADEFWWWVFLPVFSRQACSVFQQSQSCLQGLALPVLMFPGTLGSLWPALVIHMLIFPAFGCNLDGSPCFWLPTMNQMLTLISWFHSGFAINDSSLCRKVLKGYFWKVQNKRKNSNFEQARKMECALTKLWTAQPKCFQGKFEKQWILWLRSLRFLTHGSEKGTVFTPWDHSVLSYCQMLFCIYSLRALVSGKWAVWKVKGCNAGAHFQDRNCTLQQHHSSRSPSSTDSKRQELCVTALYKLCLSGSSSSSDSRCPSWVSAPLKASSVNPDTKLKWGSSEMLIQSNLQSSCSVQLLSLCMSNTQMSLCPLTSGCTMSPVWYWGQQPTPPASLLQENKKDLLLGWVFWWRKDSNTRHRAA